VVVVVVFAVVVAVAVVVVVVFVVVFVIVAVVKVQLSCIIFFFGEPGRVCAFTFRRGLRSRY